MTNLSSTGPFSMKLRKKKNRVSQVGDKKKKKQIKRRKTEKNRVSQEGDKKKKNRQAADQDSLTQAEQHRSKRRAADMMTTKRRLACRGCGGARGRSTRVDEGVHDILDQKLLDEGRGKGRLWRSYASGHACLCRPAKADTVTPTLKYHK